VLDQVEEVDKILLERDYLRWLVSQVQDVLHLVSMQAGLRFFSVDLYGHLVKDPVEHVNFLIHLTDKGPDPLSRLFPFLFTLFLYRLFRNLSYRLQKLVGRS